jgi:sugar phosphate isomerase/epimerase
MNISQVGAQLYTVRAFLQDASAFARTIERIQSIGYTAIELVHSETVSDRQIASICNAAKISIAAAHLPGSLILKNPELVVEKMRTVGSDIAVYAFPAGIDFGSRAEVEKLAHDLEKSARVLQGAGLTLAYHNHAFEFSRLNGELVYDLLLTNAPGLTVELDTYWVQFGGMSPHRWIRELKGRLVSLHLKDFSISSKHGTPPAMSEVGRGNLDFRTLVPEAEASGCRWFIVEQDITPGDPFDSLKISFDYVRKELVSA